MTPTLYISDLDGTLLGPSGRLPAQTHAALAEMLEDGLPFTVASARSVASIKALLEGLPLSLPVIEFNGAFISDLATGRHEVVNALAPDAVEGVYGLMGEFGCVPVISTFDGADDCVYFSQGSNAEMQMGNAGAQWWRDDCLARCDTRWRAASDLRRAFADQVVCLTIIDKQETLAPLEAALLAQWGPAIELHLFENMYSPGWHWLTVHDRRATKDQAIALLRETYGLQEHRLTVFGDQLNDLKMFAAADCAVAVANADPRVRGQAHRVIGPNTDSSVAGFIRSEWMPKTSTKDINI